MGSHFAPLGICAKFMIHNLNVIIIVIIIVEDKPTN